MPQRPNLHGSGRKADYTRQCPWCGRPRPHTLAERTRPSRTARTTTGRPYQEKGCDGSCANLIPREIAYTDRLIANGTITVPSR